MTDLMNQAGGPPPQTGGQEPATPQTWQERMLQQVEALKTRIQLKQLERLAFLSGADLQQGCLHLTYWGDPIMISWPDLDAIRLSDGGPCAVFDLAMLLYYLDTADGAPLADAWISFRELPDGAFYHQAYQGYSGDRLARAFAERLPDFHTACQRSQGHRLPTLAEHAYVFHPLPRLPLAAVLWQGDDEVPWQASVLFDASASHYMVTDGLALLGAGLVSRLTRPLC